MKDPTADSTSGAATDSATDPVSYSDSSSEPSPKGTGFFAVLQSIAAAGLGVQSSKNRARDFQHGKAIHFVVGGVIGTLVFLLIVWVFVKVLIGTAG